MFLLLKSTFNVYLNTGYFYRPNVTPRKTPDAVERKPAFLCGATNLEKWSIYVNQ